MAGDPTRNSRAADCIVVGAGVAGLAVARHLTAAGRSVIVLEGRDRIGGRLRSAPAATGGRVDLGATWFWPGEHRVEALVAALGVRTHEQYVAGDAMYDASGGPVRLDGNPIDVSSFRFDDGADSLTDALAAGLPADAVRRSVVVHRVDATGSGVLVHAAASSYHGRTAVLAVPPAAGVARIEFAPPLPPEIASVARATPVWMGAMVKVVAVYAEPFWRSAGLSGAAVSHRGPLREIHDMSGSGGTPAALFGFAPGDGAVTRRALLAQLGRVFGARAADPIELHVADWSAEELTSPDGVGATAAYELFGHPALREPILDGRAVWASTETGVAAPGHVEGALEAAEHAAGQVLTTLTDAPSPTSGGPT